MEYEVVVILLYPSGNLPILVCPCFSDNITTCHIVNLFFQFLDSCIINFTVAPREYIQFLNISLQFRNLSRLGLVAFLLLGLTNYMQFFSERLSKAEITKFFSQFRIRQQFIGREIIGIYLLHCLYSDKEFIGREGNFASTVTFRTYFSRSHRS